MSNPKLKVGMYWAASCGGCDVSLLDIHEKILDVVAVADLVFWPCAMDFKVHHVEAMPDGHLDLAFITGAVRNSENEHMVKLLRRKAKLVCAFGSCAHMGGIPGLANFWDRESIFKTVYKENPSTENPKGTVPLESFKAPEGELTLPHFYDTVKTLGQTIEVDYFLPGCPPNPDQIATVIGLIATGKAPARGSVVGASERAMCEECTRKKTELKFKSFKRRHLTHPDPEVCFMEQGIICVGAATRAGCGWRCIGSNMPCRGCYGPLPNVHDQGAKMLSAIAACIDADTPEDVDRILDTMPDPAGYFYRFALPLSMLRRRQRGAETTAG
jgi:F420-non-reducing hydrogenase small subunit